MPTVEEDYLEALWAEPQSEEDGHPVLLDSQVIKSAGKLARPTYAEEAGSHKLITTVGRGSNVFSPSRSPLKPLKASGPSPSQQLDAVVARIKAKRSIHERCMMELRKAGELVKSQEAELWGLQDEEDALAVANPPAPERLRKVSAWARERALALQVQGELVEAKQMELISVEAALHQAERELDFLADAQQEMDTLHSSTNLSATVTAGDLKDWELRTAEALLDKHDMVKERIEEKNEFYQDETDRIVGDAEAAQETARARLRVGLDKVKKGRVAGDAVTAAQNEARRGAVLGLKTSLAAVREDVAAKATRYRAVQKQKREVMEREFQDLLEQGLNPYEVHRERDVVRAAEKARRAIRNNITMRSEEIANQLALEEKGHVARQEAREAERLTEAQFQREMGVTAQEARTEAYMLRNTTGRVNMLDPTGHMEPNPSDVTTFKTVGFGMGKAQPRLVEKLTGRHPDIGPKDVLMPNKYKQGDMTRTIVLSASSRRLDDDVDDTALGAMGDAPPADDGSGGGGTGGWKVLETRELTKFERDAMAAAHKRHKKAIGSERQMMGRTFAGDAFMSTPAVVEFKDFEVGQTYTAKVHITNRSYEKNTYRMVQVPPEHGNVLEVAYKLPGYLATGVSGDLTVTFTPKANEDIETGLEMLADTGPFTVPIRCLNKKAKMGVSVEVVDFGPGVTLAESTSATFTLTNDGALDVEYTISVDSDSGLNGSVDGSVNRGVVGSGEPGPDGKLRSGPFTLHGARGGVPGYGRATVSVSFAPTAPGRAAVRLCITYRSPSQRRLFITPGALGLVGIGRDVPIFLENSVLDFKCCSFDHTYRDYLQVRNGGKTAMKLSVVNRPDVSDYFEFSPDFGFAQAGKAFPVMVIFKPRAKMLQQCAKFLVDTENSVFEIPMKLNVPDQRLPVNFTLRAQVTTTDLHFDPPMLDFGPCVMNENTALALRVHNPSGLPQTFGFAKNSTGVTISPNDGFGYILPGETQERVVSFQPPIAGPQSLTLTARTIAGRTFQLPVTAVGVQPDVSLSHNGVRFPATPVGDMSMVSLILSNSTERSQAFEFSVPPGSDLAFIPNVGEIPPQSTYRVQVEFSPQPEAEAEPAPAPDEEPAPPPKGAKKGGAAAAAAVAAAAAAAAAAAVLSVPEEGEEDEEEEEVDPNKWYDWHKWSVTCYIRPPSKSSRPSSSNGSGPRSGSGAASEPLGAHPGGGGGGGGGGGTSGRQLHLNVETCAVQPDIVLRTDLPRIPGKPLYELDFGPVPVGQRITRVVELYNQGMEEAPLRVSPLASCQVFGNVNTMRPVPVGGVFSVKLSFEPQQREQYMEFMTLSTPRTRVRVALKGLGIAPELKVEPPAALTDGFDMGDVYANEASERKFSVTNICPFPLTFSMLFRGVLDPNLQARPAFYARPAEGTLAQGESAEVTLVFQPSSQRPYFEDVLQVYVPNQQEQLLVPVKGRCWEEGVFVAGPSYPPPADDPFMETQLARRAGPGVGGALSAALLASASDPARPRQLTLICPDALYCGEAATCGFEVGSLRSAAVGGAPGEFALADLTAADKEAGWAVDQAKVALAVGDKKAVTFTFTAPPKVHAGLAAYFGHEEYVELRLGAVLKGGLPAPPLGPEGRRLQLTLRALLRPGERPFGSALPPSITVPGEAKAGDVKGGKKK